MQPGMLVGVYQLGAPIGEGGMGVVFGAVDTKLQRPVAIKFLTKVADAESRRRFQREAQLASSLNHPHIVTVLDAGEFENEQYLVTEFIDGGTLKDWACAQKRNWRQIVDLMIGVADGLAAAHQAGIMHRDIKPQNVLVAKNGYAKLADFGLAKLTETSHHVKDAATITDTRQGIVVGTVAYMSPEQIAGKALDARSDIFSFGIMLHELLAGRRPFVGASELEALHSIISASPPPLDESLPLELRMIVDKALEKDPADRYQTTRDLVVDLRRVARRRPEDSERVPAVVTPARRRGWLPVVTIALIVAAAAGGVLAGRWLNRRSEAAEPSGNSFLNRITSDVGMEEMAAVSPDGRSVAFVAPLNGRRQIWVRLLSGGDVVQVTRDEVDHEHPRWSPDSSALVYYTPSTTDGESGAVWEISALGGTARRLAAATSSADISHDGRLIAVFQKAEQGFVLALLGRDGGVQRPPIPMEQDSFDFTTPRWSFDDKSLAFVSGITAARFVRRLVVMDTAAGQLRVLAEATDIKGAAWLPDGSALVYASAQGSTMLYPPILNLRMISLDGKRQRQLTVGDVSYTYPDLVDPNKVFATRVRMQSDIWGFPVSGSPLENVSHATRITRQTGQVQTPSVSPDGKEIVYLSDSGGHSNLWISRTDGSASRQLTFERDPAIGIGIPVWSPAGNRIVFFRNAPPAVAQWLINPDGTGLRKRVDEGTSAVWGADGSWLYYQSGQPLCIYKVPVEDGAAVKVRCDAAVPAPSPDGATLFFAPRTFMNANEIHKATPEGGAASPAFRHALSRVPLWPTGFVMSPDGTSLAVPLKDGGTTNIWAIDTATGAFRQLTDFGQRSVLIARQVSWARDGKYVFAAVVESDADIVLLDRIVP